MIDPALEAELKSFKAQWDRALGVSPSYALDETWPSVGVIDQLTFALRQKKELTKAERKLIRGAAAYLAVMAQRCWEKLGAEADAGIYQSEVVLKATKGPKLDGGEAIAYVERDLTSLIFELPAPLPLFSTYRRMVPLQDNFVSQYAFALFTGLLPSIEGPWAKETPQSWMTQIDLVVKHLADTAAKNYGRMFPDEQLGQVAELYYSELIFPLTMMLEELPVRRAAYSLLATVENLKISPKSLARLGQNLMFSADERIAQTGFVCAAALAQSPCSPALRAFATATGASMGLLRHAHWDIRKKILGEADWLGNPEYSDADRSQIEKEIELRFFPWLKMSREKILASAGDEAMNRLLKAFTEYNMRAASSVIDDLVDLAPEDMDFRLQKIYLELLNGEVEKVDRSLKTLVTEPLSEDKPLIFDLMGNIQLVMGNLQASELYFKKARNIATSDTQIKSDVANNYGWMLMLKGDFAASLELIEESLALIPDSIAGLLNQTTVLHQLNRSQDAAKIDAKLAAIAPFHREVFRGLVYDPGLRE